MLAYDFSKTQSGIYDIILVGRDECDVTSFESVMQCIVSHEPDVVLNAAAYTRVDDAEDIWALSNYEVNTLGPYYLAKVTWVLGIQYITISTDYVFDGIQKDGYLPTDQPSPINAYGMAKYLGEKLATHANPQTTVIRTSWLYGGKLWIMYWSTEELRKQGKFKNFVNTMLTLAETRDEVRVVNDQHGRPTSCIDLCEYIATHIEKWVDATGGIFHFSSPRSDTSITWADFAREIFLKYGMSTTVIECSSSEHPTKAKRPEWSVLLPWAI